MIAQVVHQGWGGGWSFGNLAIAFLIVIGIILSM